MQSLLSNLLEANRNQRHDFLNHLQVIWGYLSLGFEDKAIEYIKEVTAYFNQLRVLNNLANLELAAYISSKVLELGLNRNFVLEIPDEWKMDEEKVQEFMDFFNKLWRIIVEKISCDQFNLKLTLTKGNIILETDNVDIKSFTNWENTKRLAEDYGFTYQVEQRKMVINTMKEIPK